MIQDIKTILTNRFPDLRIDSLVYFGEGETKKVFLVNKNIVFKIPKDDKDLKSFYKEKVALSLLKDKTDIPVPELLYYDDKVKNFPIIGQSLMQGKSLSENIFHTFSTQDKIAFFKDISTFIAQVHSITDMSQDIYAQSAKGNIEAIDKYIESVNRVLSSQDKEFLSKITERYRKSVDANGLSLVFSHGDLQFQNILYNPQNNRITAVIDFGSACYADKLYDLRYFWNTLNKDLINFLKAELTNEDRMRILYYHLCTVSRNIHIAYEPNNRTYNNSTEIKLLLAATQQGKC